MGKKTKLPLHGLGNSKISPAYFFSRLKAERDRHPFTQDSVGAINPYTKQAVKTEADYDEYLREHTYYKICDENERSKLRRLRILSVVLAMLLLVSIVTASIIQNSGSAYKDGYAAGISDQQAEDADLYDAGQADGYQKGYAEGKDKGYNEGYYKGYWEGFADAGERSAGSGDSHGESSGQHTGTGSTRDAPIADTYIGNTKTKKFHLPSCSYLPDQDHQATFDSRDEAIAAGYTPCGHCKP